MELQDEYPPVGETEIDDPQRFIIELLGLALAVILTWSLFRYLMKDVFDTISSVSFNISYILVAPFIFIGPVLYYWYQYRGEECLPVRLFADNSPKETFSQKFIVSIIIIGLSLTFINYTLGLILDYIVLSSGLYGDIDFFFTWMEEFDSFFGFLLFMVTQIAIVATIEECFYRGFIQDQLSKVLQSWQLILLSATIFALSHLPVAIFVYEIESKWLITSMINWFGFGLATGYIYHITRNIWTVIAWHGIWNVTVFTIWYNVFISETPSQGLEQFIWISKTILVNALILLAIYFTRDYIKEFGSFGNKSSAPKTIEVKL